MRSFLPEYRCGKLTTVRAIQAVAAQPQVRQMRTSSEVVFRRKSQTGQSFSRKSPVREQLAGPLLSSSWLPSFGFERS